MKIILQKYRLDLMFLNFKYYILYNSIVLGFIKYLYFKKEKLYNFKRFINQ